MSELDQLGLRHRALLAELDELRDRIADQVRNERAAGATYVDLMNRSGYTSIETIRRIVLPATAETVNKARRGRRASQ